MVMRITFATEGGNRQVVLGRCASQEAGARVGRAELANGDSAEGQAEACSAALARELVEPDEPKLWAARIHES